MNCVIDHSLQCNIDENIVIVQRSKMFLLELCSQVNVNQLQQYNYVFNTLEPIQQRVFPTYLQYKSTMSRAHRAKLPIEPTIDTITTFNIPPNFIELQNIGNILIGRQQAVNPRTHEINGIIIFGNPHLVANLIGSEHIAVDGTFKVCPRPFKQLFSFGYFVNINQQQQKMFIGLYVLCTHKNIFTYNMIINNIKDIFGADNVKWSFVMCDYEASISNAFSNGFQYNNLQVRHCYFHYSQAIYRKISELGLSGFYIGANNEFREYVLLMKSLNFLPLNRVLEGFHIIENMYHRNIKLQADVNPYHCKRAYKRFIKYMKRNWLHENKIDRCNVYDLGQHRTNNDMEGIHNRFKKTLQTSKNIFIFLTHLKNEIITENNTYNQAVNAVGPIIARNRRKEEKEEAIATLKLNLQNNVIGIGQFLIDISLII